MSYNFDELIQFHLDNTTKDNKPILVVFKGFGLDFYEKINLEKLFSLSLTVDLLTLDQSKASLLPEVFMKLSQLQGRESWCTYEEYIVLGDDILNLYFNTIIMGNNLFHKTYPCLYPIPESDRLLETYFSEDVQYTGQEQDPIHDVFQKYYGDLKMIGLKWYIVYTKDEDAQGFYSVSSISLLEQKISSLDDATFEISEEEDELLKITDALLSNELSQQEIRISFAGDLDAFPHRYRDRLLILQAMFPQHQFTLVTKTTDINPLLDETKYLDILKKYWGYTSFRNLKMYKDIHDPEFKKETIEIPQSMIIDDIVKQAEAALQTGSYKDVFVTSPTGAGKSVMFQVPAIYLAEQYNLMTVVISPLIGLMTDQVQGLINRNVGISATINSEITPVQKMDIAEKIREGKISILYISPETLLSRSDISQLIGERKVGLFVIDEAHIVTTWGKAFRSDYWYLGNYLQRLRKEMQFPVVTFTATAIYGGMEDMYAETRDSLNLINPISYFGYVKRDDLEVRIKQKDQTKERFSEYLEEKFKILTFRLEQFLKRKQKTLIYFPTISLINNYLDFAKIYGSEPLNEGISYYYGPLDKERKNANYLRFKSNESIIMLATKAFGMGIDIPDITNVYHFAPTGNVCDYVQEIGRAARALEKGYAYFDFLPKDFIHVNRLHGISTIRKQQLIQVMGKVLQILEGDKNRPNLRNMLINAEEFRYIFQRGANTDANDDIDNKLKTALLIIEKDFKAKLGYSPIIARPRSVFAKEYFMVQREHDKLVKNTYKEYFTLARSQTKGSFGDIFICDMKKIWEDHYRNLSFPQFKYKFHSKDESLKLSFLEYLLPVLQIEVSLKLPSQNSFLTELSLRVDKIAGIFGEYAKTRKYFTIDEVALDLRKKLGGDKYSSENLASILIYSAENYDRIMRKHSNFYNRFIIYNEVRNCYTFQNSGYAGFTDWIRNETRQLLSQSSSSETNASNYESFLPKVNREKVEKSFILLGILEAMGLILYRVNGGDNPEIFLRINSRLQIKRSLQDSQYYNNHILENVYLRHKISVAMLTHLFKNQVDNHSFWEYIENYFLGRIPEEVLAEVR